MPNHERSRLRNRQDILCETREGPDSRGEYEYDSESVLHHCSDCQWSARRAQDGLMVDDDSDETLWITWFMDAHLQLAALYYSRYHGLADDVNEPTIAGRKSNWQWAPLTAK
jgi:hypothetical protein